MCFLLISQNLLIKANIKYTSIIDENVNTDYVESYYSLSLKEFSKRELRDYPTSPDLTLFDCFFFSNRKKFKFKVQDKLDTLYKVDRLSFDLNIWNITCLLKRFLDLIITY